MPPAVTPDASSHAPPDGARDGLRYLGSAASAQFRRRPKRTMKPLSSLRPLFVCLALGSLAVAPFARAADPNTSITLQVQVTLPRTHQPNPDPQLVSAFVSRIRDTFAHQGYVGAIAEASPGRDLPNETAVLLNLDVSDLRVRDGKLDCRFTASVRTHAELLELGQFRDKGLPWNRDAAQLGQRERRAKPGNDPTMLRLYRSLAASRLVPGLTGS